MPAARNTAWLERIAYTGGMGNRRGLALVLGLIVPSLACTAVTGLGKSYEFSDDASSSTVGDASLDSSDAARDTGVDAPATTCPNITGSFAMDEGGSDCQDFNKGAKQCIRAVPGVSCSVKFVSALPVGSLGVNGNADVQPDGTFKNATLTLGSKVRTGCTGIWTEASGILVVNCGGFGTTQSCTVTMNRSVAAGGCG